MRECLLPGQTEEAAKGDEIRVARGKEDKVDVGEGLLFGNDDLAEGL